MAYNNNNNNNNYSRSYNYPSGYNRNSYQPSAPRQQYKKSGATYTPIRKEWVKKGYDIVNAWRITKNGLMTLTASPYQSYSDSGKPIGVIEHESSKGNTCIRVKVEIRQGANYSKFYSLMDLRSKKIFIRELNLIVSPNGQGQTRSGKYVKGYFGTYKPR